MTNGGDQPDDDSHHIKAETGNNIRNRKAVPCDYAARHAAPSEEVTAPLRRLLIKDATYRWDEECKTSFRPC